MDLIALREGSTFEEIRAIVADPRHAGTSRARALSVLRLLNDRAIRAKLPMLLLERPSDRIFLWEVAKTIVVFGVRRARAAAREMLHEEEASSREIAAWLLGLIGGNASRSLLESVLENDQNAAVRAEAAESLGTPGSKRSVPALIRALHDRSPRVRYSAAQALAEIGDPAALVALRGRVNDAAKAYATTVGHEVRRAIRKLRISR